jgi:hypothetical protein
MRTASLRARSSYASRPAAGRPKVQQWTHEVKEQLGIAPVCSATTGPSFDERGRQVFLAAIAIFDDLGAIAIVAVFYAGL